MDAEEKSYLCYTKPDPLYRDSHIKNEENMGNPYPLPQNPEYRYSESPKNEYPESLENQYPENAEHHYPDSPKNEYLESLDNQNPENQYPDSSENQIPDNNHYLENHENKYPENPDYQNPENTDNPYPENPENQYPKKSDTKSPKNNENRSGKKSSKEKNHKNKKSKIKKSKKNVETVITTPDILTYMERKNSKDPNKDEYDFKNETMEDSDDNDDKSNPYSINNETDLSMVEKMIAANMCDVLMEDTEAPPPTKKRVVKLTEKKKKIPEKPKVDPRHRRENPSDDFGRSKTPGEMTRIAIRGQIIGMYKAGTKNVTQIAKEVGCSRATVYMWIRRHEEEGCLLTKPKVGSSRKTTWEQERAIIARKMENPDLTALHIQQAEGLHHLSLDIIRSRLHDAGIYQKQFDSN